MEQELSTECKHSLEKSGFVGSHPLQGLQIQGFLTLVLCTYIIYVFTILVHMLTDVATTVQFESIKGNA